MHIDKDSKLREILTDERIRRVFDAHELYCGKCKGAAEDTVRHVIINNAFCEKDFIDELNNAVK